MLEHARSIVHDNKYNDSVSLFEIREKKRKALEFDMFMYHCALKIALVAVISLVIFLTYQSYQSNLKAQRRKERNTAYKGIYGQEKLSDFYNKSNPDTPYHRL